MIRLFVLILLSVLSGCKPADSGVKLGGSNYFLEDKDRSHIYITKATQDQFVVAVDQMVVDYKIDGQFLFVLQKVASSYDCQSENGKATIVTIYTNQDAYWIVDMKSNLEFGPLDRHAYLEKGQSMGLEVPNLTAPLDYISNEDTLRTAGAKCVSTEHVANTRSESAK